jgi:hypothetical protein
MMPGTSPSLVEAPAGNGFLPSGGEVAVFQGSDGHAWFSMPTGSSSMGTATVMAPGTSPTVILTTTNGGGWQAFWQGANNDLWTTGAGPTDLGLPMTAGTSPSVTDVTSL